MIQISWFVPFGCPTRCFLPQFSFCDFFSQFTRTGETQWERSDIQGLEGTRRTTEGKGLWLISFPPETTPEVPLCEQPFQIWASPVCFAFSQGTAWPAEHCLPHFCLIVNLKLAKAFQILSLFSLCGARPQNCSCSWGLTLGRLEWAWNGTWWLFFCGFAF